jgi:hypothetical protein
VKGAIPSRSRDDDDRIKYLLLLVRMLAAPALTAGGNGGLEVL